MTQEKIFCAFQVSSRTALLKIGVRNYNDKLIFVIVCVNK